MLLVAASNGFTPVWPYIVGGIAAIVTAVVGGWRLYIGWRQGVEEEAEKKVLNTQALTENTRAAAGNTAAIATLTQRLDRWEARWEMFAEKTEGRLDTLEHQRRAPPRRRPTERTDEA